MNRKIFSIIGLIILSLLLFGAGIWVGQAHAFNTSGQSGWMMNNTNNIVQPGYDMMNGQNGSMMDGSNMMGMMNGFGGLRDIEPLSVEAAETAVADYLITLNQNTLELGEIMIFDNHAYAQILDAQTGQGAFELLIDPATGNAFPEPGPNMMWNTDYGMDMQSMMGGSGMMGGMMNGQSSESMMNGSADNMMGNWGTATDKELSITAADAPNLAQTYLDSALPGTTVDDHADTFPGYYTLHIERDGEVIGMLSVNAHTGDVFLHHWHGDFVEMTDTH